MRVAHQYVQITFEILYLIEIRPGDREVYEKVVQKIFGAMQPRSEIRSKSVELFTELFETFPRHEKNQFYPSNI